MAKTKVKILQSIAGLPEPLYDLSDFSFLPGQVIELHPKLAEAWIAGGIAEAFKEEQERETTSVEVPEKAVLPEAAPRKVGRPPKVTI